MKTKITALLLAAVTAVALVPKQAQAGDKEAALIGGLIGGLVLGAALNDSRSDYDGYDSAVVVQSGYGYNPGYGRDRYDRAGYWDYRTVRVWVPASWEFRYVHGYRERVYVPGYWTHRRDRVWVAHHGRGHHRGHDRGYDRGYDRRHDDRRRW